ncbi:cytochrome c4 [Comamonas sp. Y33R10-2]|uniref:c-type cytochrome n=1 Tax=Comamonas sp. Y33R10-2 TaxID=2853257 RepID=UPI001C5C9F06|nr:c-type cytochrome [Comamonas sp. Y33R10-2]QXZ09490.1 cytochrome c4 [Comamonas sp. Y33R10-2]
MIKNWTTVMAVVVASVTGMANAEAVKGDAKAGEGKIAMCIGCHGISGYQASFPEVYKVPMIGGQNEAYIVSALNAYKKGERKHPSMRGIADPLTDQDIADVAAFYAGHGKAKEGKPKEANAAVTALLQKGACFSCHGDGFAKPIDPSYPKVAGQYADYVFRALQSYKVENNPHIGRSNGVMAGITKQFKNDELQQLAKYIGSLDSELQVVTQPHFRFGQK